MRDICVGFVQVDVRIAVFMAFESGVFALAYRRGKIFEVAREEVDDSDSGFVATILEGQVERVAGRGFAKECRRIKDGRDGGGYDGVFVDANVSISQCASVRPNGFLV